MDRPVWEELDTNMGKLVTEYVDLTDARIAYRQCGNGSILLLLHGNSESKQIFSKYQTDYFPMFHTVAIDSRGHGETVSNDEEYTIAQYADDVIALCKAKGFAEAYVIGYSDGGNIALHLAKKAPGTFKRLVAISPNYLAGGTTAGVLRLMRITAKVFGFLGKLGLPTRRAIMRLNLMLNDIGITAEELAGIRTNIRILYAEHDLIKEEHILEMGRLIPNAGVRKIDHCNHITILDKEETIKDISEFLRV
jgi:pimeloyl-ACP methyl ester carboxylesterase